LRGGGALPSTPFLLTDNPLLWIIIADSSQGNCAWKKSGSASPPARRVLFMSGTPAPPCSTGFTPARKAAFLSYGSKTPTSNGRGPSTSGALSRTCAGSVSIGTKARTRAADSAPTVSPSASRSTALTRGSSWRAAGPIIASAQPRSWRRAAGKLWPWAQCRFTADVAAL
jgi:hypothetical protein